MNAKSRDSKLYQVGQLADGCKLVRADQELDLLQVQVRHQWAQKVQERRT